MTITNGYLTAAEASAYVQRQFADSTGILDDVVTAASRTIDRYCGRHFYTVTATRYFEVEELCELDLGPYNDLVSVTTLKTDNDGDGVYETTWTTDQYLLCPKGATARAPQAQPYTEIELLNGLTFPYGVTTGREALIEIAGSWGWPSVPIEVKQACRILVAELGKLQDAPLGVVGQSEFGVFRVSNQLPPAVRRMLQPFVHPDHVGIG